MAIALATLVLTAASAPAQSPLDFAPLAWGGAYFGVHGGGGWGGTDEFGDIPFDGGLGGLHGGYNWQSGSVVFGIEGDASFGRLSGEVSEVLRQDFFGTVLTTRGSVDVDVTALTSLRARVGYAAGPVMIYATAGPAWAWFDLGAEASLTGGGFNLSESVSGSDVLFGFTLGGGAELKFTRQISARLDVAHYRFSDSFNDNSIEFDDVEVNATVVRGGLTFHFN